MQKIGRALIPLALFAAIAPAAAQSVEPESPASTDQPVDSIPVSVPDAADNQPPDKAPRPQSRLIEEVVVTAQKREEAIQDVPISIAAFSAESLDARGVFDTKSLPSITSAMSISEFGGFAFVYIRGVGSDAFVPSADPSVTTYVDGVFVPTSQGFSTDFGGVERVEVLKGPQGTLFGRNSTGGAINVVTKKPGGLFAADLQGEIGNYNERRAKAYVNIPITDSFGISVDGLYKDVDNQYTNTSREIVPQKSKSGRARLNWQATDNLNLDVAYFKSVQEGTGSLISKNIKPSPLFSFIAAVPGGTEDNRVSDTDFPSFVKGGSHVTSATVTLNLTPFDLKLSGADQLTNSDYSAYDFDGSSLPLVAFRTSGQFTKAKNAELQLLSKPDGFLGESFEYVIGAYYLKGEGGFKQIYLEPAPGLFSAFLQSPLTNLGDLLDNPVFGGLVDLLDQDVAANVFARGAVGTKSLSGYSQITWHATDIIDLTAGGRYQSEKRYLTFADTSLYIPATDTTQLLLPFQLQSNRTNNFSSRLVASVKPQDGWLFYASRAQGFKSGTYNVINIYAPPSFVKPELATAYELGMKADFFDRALRLNAALFENRIKNKQTGFVSLISGGAVVLGNAERTNIKGAEFDMTLVPLAELDPGLVVTANGAYLHARYTQYTDGPGFDDVTGIYNSGQNYTGSKVERTPKVSGGLGISQTVDVSNGEIEVAADAYYNSGFYYSPENYSDYKEDAFVLTNAHVSYLYQPWNVRVTAFGKNILDETYHISKFRTDFGLLSTLAYGPQYGLLVDVKF